MTDDAEEPIPSDRRAFLQGAAGVAGVGATWMLSGVAPADAEAPSMHDAVLTPRDLPPIPDPIPHVPGTTWGSLGLGDLVPVAVGSGQPVAGMFVFSGTPSVPLSIASLRGEGFLVGRLAMPEGSFLERVDVFGLGTGAAPATKLRKELVRSAVYQDVATLQPAGQSSGIYQGTYAPGNGFFVGAWEPVSVWIGTKELVGPSEVFFGVSGVIYQYTPPAHGLTVLKTPSRIYDSRPGYPPPQFGPKTPLINGEQRTIDATVTGHVPADAKAVLVNLTAVNTSAAGWIAAYDGLQPLPPTSNLNWDEPSTVIANTAVVRLEDARGRFVVYCAGQTDLVVDLVGFYAP